MTRREFARIAATSTGLLVGARHPARAADRVLSGGAGLSAPEDRTRSPFTGYTRRHWLEIAERLLAGILPHLDPASGMPRLDGVAGDRGHARLYPLGPTAAKWQAMERIMMLAVYYTAATGRDEIPGWRGSITAPFLRGITRMTDPGDALHCPRIDPSVYLGSETALAVMLSPRLFWEPLSAGQRERVLDFLEELAFQKAYNNNHYLFHMVPMPFLERHGRKSNRAHWTKATGEMLQWDRGDGWLIDGSNRGFDHYNFWGFQLYFNVLLQLDARWRDEFGGRVRKITGEFLQNARFLFGRDGGPVPWGRSLAYRFADLAAIGWAGASGANPLPPGQARRLASGCLRYFWDRGALHENGVLETGYHGANAVVAEDYLTDGTGYFAAQGLSCLLLPESSPFWTERELPLPADAGGGRITLKGAEMVVRVRREDGEARLYPVGQPFGQAGRWQRGVKYCQHAYSSALGWCALGEGSPDLGAGRSGYSADGVTWVYRSYPTALEISAHHVASSCKLGDSGRPGAKAAPASAPPLPGDLVTHTLIGEDGEVHVLWHTCPVPLHLHLGGYGINVAAAQQLRRESGARSQLIAGADRESRMELVDGPPGKFAVDVLPPRPGWRHSHLFGGLGAFPCWRSTTPVPAFTPVILHVDGAVGRTLRAGAARLLRAGRDLSLSFEEETFNLTIA